MHGHSVKVKDSLDDAYGTETKEKKKRLGDWAGAVWAQEGVSLTLSLRTFYCRAE